MNQPRNEIRVSGCNLSNQCLLDSLDVPAGEPTELCVQVLLGAGDGRLAGGGATYTLWAEIVRTVGGVSETLRLPPRRVSLGAVNTSLALSLALHVRPGDTVRVLAQSSASTDAAVGAALWYYDTGSVALSSAASVALLASLLQANVDSTGQALPLGKALEAAVAVLAGNASFDPASGVEQFLGRDGVTPLVTLSLSGNGVRGASTIL